MPKSSVADMLAEGFRPEQFGFNDDQATAWSAPGGYLDKLVNEAGRWASAKVGATLYTATAADSYAHDCLARAEINYARSILYKRRIAFIDSNATLANALPAHAERKGYANDAERALQCALTFLAEAQRELGVDPTDSMTGTGASMGVVETGRYPATNTAAA